MIVYEKLSKKYNCEYDESGAIEIIQKIKASK